MHESAKRSRDHMEHWEQADFHGLNLSLKEFLREPLLLPVHNAGLRSAGKTYGESIIQCSACCGFV